MAQPSKLHHGLGHDLKMFAIARGIMRHPTAENLGARNTLTQFYQPIELDRLAEISDQEFTSINSIFSSVDPKWCDGPD
jgi:hypothetical protein